MPRNQFVTALQPQQRPCAFEAAFGKHANNPALGDFFRCDANSGMRMPRVDRDALQQLQKWIQDRFAIKFLVDDVTNWARAGELQNDCIHPGDVVRQEQKSALRQIVSSECSDPIKATYQRPAEEIERAFSGGHGSHCLSFTINAWPSAIGNWRWKAA